MDSEQGKVFIGGISWVTTEEKLKDYFKRFGDVVEAVIMKDRLTGRPRGFGFLVFADPAVADRLLLDSKHSIDGHIVEVKKAVSRDKQHSITRSNVDTVGQSRTKKIFVGGLAPTVTENDMRKYFDRFGKITDAAVMYDPGTQTSRGFGFITFDSEDAVDIVVQNPFYDLNGKMVEVKRSIPKELISSGHIRFHAGKGANFGASYGNVLNSTPTLVGGYGPPMNTSYGYGAALAGTGSYSIYGPTGAPSYGTGAGYGPAITGSGYDTSTDINYGEAPITYGAPVAYAAGSAGNGGLYGTPAMAYGNIGSSVGYGGPTSAGISHYGIGQVDNGQ